MRRPLFRGEAPAEADVRPTLLGVVTLLFLLLFFLLATSSGQRLGTIALRFGSGAELAPLPHSGLLRSLRVEVAPGSILVLAEVATTDIAASSTTSERRSWEIPTGRLAELDSIVTELHSLDPAQQRALIIPGDAVSTELLLGVLDVVRGPGAAPRFPLVSLSGIE